MGQITTSWIDRRKVAVISRSCSICRAVRSSADGDMTVHNARLYPFSGSHCGRDADLHADADADDRACKNPV